MGQKKTKSIKDEIFNNLLDDLKAAGIELPTHSTENSQIITSGTPLSMKPEDHNFQTQQGHSFLASEKINQLESADNSKFKNLFELQDDPTIPEPDPDMSMAATEVLAGFANPPQEDLIDSNSLISSEPTQVIEATELVQNNLQLQLNEGHEEPDEDLYKANTVPLSLEGAPAGFAHHLKIAQNRILALEKEVDQLREENDLLTLAVQTGKSQIEEFNRKFKQLEQIRIDEQEQAQAELKVYQDNLNYKESERSELEAKIQNLETAISKEIKQVRKRERELENRLEMSKLERAAILKSKDDSILGLKRKVDELQSEIKNYQHQYKLINSKVDQQQSQLSRTVKALRLALAHLESSSEISSIPFKKAE